MLNSLKNKFFNFSTYMLGLDKQLANAKDDKERVNIQKQIIETQRKRINELDDENIKLKEQLKEQEEIESILSSGSSVNSVEGIDTKIDQNIKDLETLMLNSKKSTATIRKEIKLLKRIKKLKFLNHQKDLEIQKLKGSNDLSKLNRMLDEANQKAEVIDESLIQTQSLIEIK